MVMAIDTRSEEEKKKRREAFERGRANLGLGASNAPAGFMGAGALATQAKQIPQQAPVQRSPQVATNIAAQEREQALTQQRQAQTNQTASRNAAVQDTRRGIQDILKLPASQQTQAAQGLRQNTPAPARTSAINPSLGLMPAQAAAANQPVERLTELGGGVKKPTTDAKINLNFPVGKPSRGEDKWNPKDYPSVYAGKQAIPEEAVPGSYVEQPQQTAPPRIGFDPVNNPQTIQRSGGGNGFRMPNAPTRSWSERQEREALLRDASTAYKGSQNGQLTAKQMELRAGIVGADDKYKNDRYGAQLSAASQLAQTQMSQEGANERAALGEANSNSRFNSQLGFDAGKFQQTAEQQQQANSLASRRLDIEQSNSDVTNYAPKQLNALYEKYDTAQSDEDRSAIAAQIQTLKGTNDKSDKEYWTNIGGGETLSADGLTSTKNPDILLNRNTGETRALPAEPIDYESDPRAQAIINDRSLSKDERRKQLEALR